MANLTDPGDAARVKFLCLDINLEWPWSAFDHGAVRKKLTGLKEVSFGLEKPRLDVQGEIAMRPLDEGDQWRFMRESKILGGPLTGSKVFAWLPETVEIAKNRYIGRSGLGEAIFCHGRRLISGLSLFLTLNYLGFVPRTQLSMLIIKKHFKHKQSLRHQTKI